MNSSDNWWSSRIVDYREEPCIEHALASAKKFKFDMSTITELQTYFPHLETEDQKVRQIRGPADLSIGLEVADRMLHMKDRASHIITINENFKGSLERLHSIVRSHLFSKKEVMGLKNDAQRQSIVSLTCPEVESRLSKAGRILDTATRVVSNINQSYNILKLQVDILTQLRYEGGLTKSLSKNLSRDL